MDASPMDHNRERRHGQTDSDRFSPSPADDLAAAENRVKSVRDLSALLFTEGEALAGRARRECEVAYSGCSGGASHRPFPNRPGGRA